MNSQLIFEGIIAFRIKDACCSNMLLSKQTVYKKLRLLVIQTKVAVSQQKKKLKLLSLTKILRANIIIRKV